MIKTVLLDLDGTVYEGRRLIEGADEAVANMRRCGLKVVFCTNNSSKTPASIAKKLCGMGIPCTEEDVVSSGQIAIETILSGNLKKVYFVGSDEMRSEMAGRGVDLCNENEAECLLIAMDTAFDYGKMVAGVRAALRAGRILVCNRDRLYPREDGLCPGCGAIVSSILDVTGRVPDAVLGKPNVAMIDYVSKITGNGPEEMLVIGDGEESDAGMAESYGSPYLLITPKPGGNHIASLKDTVGWDWRGKEFRTD